MIEDVRQAKHPVSAILAGPYGHPFHPMLVTVPIGAWVTSLIFDLASRFVASPGFLARGSSWLIAIGIIGAVIAALIGFLDLLLIPPGTEVSRTVLLHLSLALTVTAAYIGNLVWRHAEHGRPGAVAVGPLMLSVLSLAVLGFAGYLGGKLAFRYGVRVAEEATQATGFRVRRSAR
jgi:uncharacterized membrane protein